MRLVRTFAITFAITLIFGLVFLGGYLLGGRQRASAAASDPAFATLWSVQDLLKSEFLGDVPNTQAQVYGAIHGLVQTYNDPFTVFVEPAPRTLERDDLAGHFGGVGANMSRNQAGDLVLSPLRDRPAARAGVLDGDVLIAVDGKPVTAQMPIDQVVVMVRGDVGTRVVLTLRRAGRPDPFDIAVVREQIQLPSVDWRVLDEAQHVGYVHISLLGEQTSAELKSGLAELAKSGVNKLVLDLRGDGGGYLDAAVDTTSQLLHQGTVLREVKRGGEETVYSIKAVDSPAFDWPLVVLVDGGTASAAEIISGALHDQKRAILIGEKTYGKGSVQRVHELPDGSSLHVTVARWLTPDRHQIDKAGLQPDVQVALTADDRNAGKDPQLDRATAWLRGER